MTIYPSIIIPARAADTNANSNTDYGEYDDDESSRSPGNLEKPTMPPKLPYFDQGQVIQYVLPNASSVQLDCPVKNYDGKFASLGGVAPPNGGGAVFPAMLTAHGFSLLLPQPRVMSYSGTATTRSSPTMVMPSKSHPSTAWTSSLRSQRPQ